MFVDGRLSRSVNLSANLGYILNSNPKDPNGVALLDRPDELIAGIGVDFPINKYVQPMAELRSTQYVGGRTPNAFPNNPVEFLAGIKIYPARWWGFGAWYRRALNDQRAKNINAVDAKYDHLEHYQRKRSGPRPRRRTGNGRCFYVCRDPAGIPTFERSLRLRSAVVAWSSSQREPAILPNRAARSSISSFNHDNHVAVRPGIPLVVRSLSGKRQHECCVDDNGERPRR
jgi:hypothetical protein